MGTVPTDDPFDSLAHTLAGNPELIKALLQDHCSDNDGFCRTCTTGGTGTHTVETPCGVRRLAELAAAICSGDAS